MLTQDESFEVREADYVYDELKMTLDSAPRHMAFCCITQLMGDMLRELSTDTQVKVLNELLAYTREPKIEPQVPRQDEEWTVVRHHRPRVSRRAA